MRIEWAMPCRTVENDDRGTNVYGAWVDTGIVPSFPTGVRVTAVVCIVASHEDLCHGEEHVIRRVVRAPNLDEVGRGRLVFALTPDVVDDGTIGDEGRVIHAISTEFWAPEPGRYLFEFQLDGGEIATVPFNMRRG